MTKEDLNFTGYEQFVNTSLETIINQNWTNAYEEGIAKLINCSKLKDLNSSHKNLIIEHTIALAQAAYVEKQANALYSLQKSLFFLYNQFIEPPSLTSGINQYEPFLLEIRMILENAWYQFEESRVPSLPDCKNMSIEDFSLQIKEVWKNHHAYSHEVFSYLSNDASREAIVFYIQSDYALNVRFYDLISLSLVAIPENTRIEVAHNYWDEVGKGNPDETHIQLYRNVLNSVSSLSKNDYIDLLGTNGLSGYNLLLKQVLARKDYFRSIGALAVTELADPQQYIKFIDGCKRVGIYSDKFKYYSEHIDIDALHGESWIDHVIIPVANSHPECRNQILEGCYMRLNTSADYWDEIQEKMKSL